MAVSIMSPLVRGAWIEIRNRQGLHIEDQVAPRERGVD